MVGLAIMATAQPPARPRAPSLPALRLAAPPHAMSMVTAEAQRPRASVGDLLSVIPRTDTPTLLPPTACLTTLPLTTVATAPLTDDRPTHATTPVTFQQVGAQRGYKVLC